MRTEFRSEVFMSSISSLTRGLVVVATVLAGTASAQAPANDTCAGAVTLAPTTPNVPIVGAPVSILNAAVVSESPFSCQTTNGYSIWYTITPSVAGTYRFETCTTTSPLDTVSDTVLAIYTGTCGGTLTEMAAGCNDDSCGVRSSLMINLVAGTQYYVQVGRYGTSTPTAGSDVLQVSATQVTAPPNDSCAGTVTPLLVNTPALFSTNTLTLNDSQLGGNLDGGAGTCFIGLGHSTTASANAAPGRDVVFGFVPPTSGAYSVRLGFPSNSLDTVLYLTDSCVAAVTPPQIYAPPQCIAASNRGGSSSTAAEELVCVPMTSGTPYFVWADETALSSTGASYELEVTACTLEVEPNDTPATAGALACPVTGRISANAEADFFSLGANPVGSRVFALVEAAAAGTAGSTSTDFDLRVTSATDTLEYDDLNVDTLFGGSSGTVAGTPLPNAPAYLRVSYFSTTSTREPYRLYSVVQTATPTPEIEPNDTNATANGGASNYFSGDVPTTADVDNFAFEARAGDLVFIGLDAQPTRTGTTSTGNHNLKLLNAAGTVLVAVDDSGTSVSNTASPATLTGTTPSVPAESLVYRIRANGTYVARVGRSSTTGSGQYGLSISIGCGPGGGIGAPSLTSLTPPTGTISGGTPVTLSGSNFSSLATVTIGGVAATVISRTATSIQVTTPPGSEGAVDVVVTNPGAQTTTLTGGFTYFSPVAPPTITSVTPVSGPTAGGTVITLNGTLFKPGALVTLTVGATALAATSVVIVNSTQLLATTPAHAAGPATVTVRNPVDALEGSLAAAFTYLAPPSVSTITPNTGFTSGGLTVTITGTALRTGATVTFGANAGTSVVVDPSGLSLTVTTPAALTAGAVNVTVTNSDTQQTVVNNGFTYNYPVPTITTVTPAQGFAVGGTTLTIVGTGFQPSPTVTIGGAPATNVTRTSLTQLTAVTPAGTGLVDVTVTNTDLQSVTRTGGYRYVAAPALTGIAPTHGPVQGGTLVTLTGTDFQPGASVRFGGVPAFAVTVTSPTTATAVTNANAAGAVDVQLVNPDTQSSTLARAFTYDAAPTLASLSPTSGTTAGGTTVTLTGTGFLAGVAVLFGSDAATSVTVVSPTQLTAITPVRPVGVVSVTVRNLDNQSAELARAYRFVAPPTVMSAAPGTGDVAGGTVVRVTGTGFGASTTVSFGATAAAQVSLVSATELDAVTPAHMPGAVDVVVSTDGAIATLTGGFTFTRSQPTLVAIAPPSGPIAGGALVTLTGTGFAPGATVSVGGAMATDVVVVSNVLARAVVPAHAAGAVNVVLTNDDQQAATLAGAFTYVAPPSNTAGTVTDGGTGSLGEGPTGGGGGAGGVSCGCSSFDGSMFSMAGMGLLLVLARRRRR
jgi:uncharacterized protein (TIGR03382 family)